MTTKTTRPETSAPNQLARQVGSLRRRSALRSALLPIAGAGLLLVNCALPIRPVQQPAAPAKVEVQSTAQPASGRVITIDACGGYFRHTLNESAATLVSFPTDVGISHHSPLRSTVERHE